MTQNSKILVTGGAGFIGSEFVRQAIKRNLKVIVLDNLNYAGDLMRLASVANKFKFYKVDITNKAKVLSVLRKEKPQTLVHFAAQTHVDRSIQDVEPFIQTNIIGTQNLIKAGLSVKIKKFIHISTDEIYGEIEKGAFKENTPLNPNNPYSATKAAADLLIKSAIRTYNLPAIIIRSSNNYGHWQYPEKFIPVIIYKARKGQSIPVYGRGINRREWLHVSDCCKAIFRVIKKGRVGEIYNVGSNTEKKNIDVARSIVKKLKQPLKLIEFVKDRPGHDIRYKLSCQKIRKLGWKPELNFDEGINQTLTWAIDNFDWIEDKTRSLKTYWKKVYKKP